MSQARQNPGYVDPDYLQMLAERIQDVKQKSYGWMKLQPGHRVLDVGCGPAIDTIPLAGLVGSDGAVCGVDYDHDMIVNANKQSEEAGLSAQITHQQADAEALPFPDDHFDSCRSERVFQHVPHPQKVLAEMMRVTRPGGRVVVIDTDFGSLSIDSSEDHIERTLTRVTTEASHYNGYAGRQLFRYFQVQGFVDCHVEMLPFFFNQLGVMRRIFMLDKVEDMALKHGQLSAEEISLWHKSLEESDKNGTLFGSVSQVLLAGQVPQP